MDSDAPLHPEPHETSFKISEVILGGQDGIVNTLGVILGIAAASRNVTLVIAGGLAAAFAESISMAAVAYTSTLANADYYVAELNRERREIEEKPDHEREEVRELYRRKGLAGEQLESVVATITSDKNVWLRTMMQEELRLAPVDRKGARKTSLIVGVSAIIGSLLPLVPFFFVRTTGVALLPALGISAVALFLVGWYKATRTVGHAFRSGAEMAVIGVISALAGYVIGLLFNSAVQSK